MSNKCTLNQKHVSVSQSSLNLLDSQAQAPGCPLHRASGRAGAGHREPGSRVAAPHPGLQSTCCGEKTGEPAFESKTIFRMIKKIKNKKKFKKQQLFPWVEKNTKTKRLNENKRVQSHTEMGRARQRGRRQQHLWLSFLQGRGTLDRGLVGVPAWGPTKTCSPQHGGEKAAVAVLGTAMVPAGRAKGRGAAFLLSRLYLRCPSKASSAPGKSRDKSIPISTAALTLFFSCC